VGSDRLIQYPRAWRRSRVGRLRHRGDTAIGGSECESIRVSLAPPDAAYVKRNPSELPDWTAKYGGSAVRARYKVSRARGSVAV
jgi:hypothetical protein